MIQAVIMAGGEGARLRPLTCDLPKPMAPVANRPIMGHIVNLLRRQGVSEAFVTLHYLADEVESYFGDGSDFGLKLDYSVEDVPLGTAGSVGRLGDRLNRTFVIISGDALTDFDLRPAIEFHQQRGAMATLVLTRVADPLEYGVVIVDEEGTVERFLEKPSPGEVFSDTVNTGIYILEPEVLQRVPAGRQFDFSKDLYPTLLAEGQLLCGYVAEGYWTDIGTLEQYRMASEDCLRGAVSVEMPGEQTAEGVWMGENTRLHPSARIEPPVLIGRGCGLGPGVHVGPFSIIGDNCLLEVTERGSKVTMSLIWGTKWPGTLFGASGVTGLANIEITPEYAARLAAAFGVYLEPGAQVITSRDSHSVSRMIKRAMIAGLMSVGANVLDLRVMPGAVARHMAHISGAAGGVHVAVSPADPTQTLIEFFDGTGKNLDRPADRKIESIFFREDFRRVPRDAVGNLEFLGRTMEYYTEGFLNFVDAEAIRRWGPKLVIDYAHGPLCLLMPLVLGRLGCESTALNAFVDPTRSQATWAERQQSVTGLCDVLRALRADLGVLMGSHGERFALIDDEGAALVGDDLLLAFMDLVLQAGGTEGRVAVPFSATAGAEEICARHGATCVRTKADARSLMERAGSDSDLMFAGDSEGGFIFPRFLPAFDAMLALGKLLELLATSETKLSAVRSRLPQYHRAEAHVECPWEQKGMVMRRLHEDTQGLEVEHLDGIKILLDGEWVLVLPDVSAPRFHVRAESGEAARAEALVDKYAARIRELQEEL